MGREVGVVPTLINLFACSLCKKEDEVNDIYDGRVIVRWWVSGEGGERTREQGASGCVEQADLLFGGPEFSCSAMASAVPDWNECWDVDVDAADLEPPQPFNDRAFPDHYFAAGQLHRLRAAAGSLPLTPQPLIP